MNHILIALSGGVDSAVAAASLLEQNHKVTALTMNFHSLDPRSIAQAKNIADKLGIEHHTMDLTSQFKDQIIGQFIEQYKAGNTPNPCIFCNPLLKFATLTTMAQELNCDFIATGHYAQIKEYEGYYHIAKASNITKDQSYVLYRLGQNVLRKLLFPLNKITDKSQVRSIAKQLDLEVHDKKDSQDICFIPDNDYKKFLLEKDPSLQKKGEIILEQTGQVLGTHSGVAFHTIGQRRGLGIAYSQPLYITKMDYKTNKIFVSVQENLYKTTLTAKDVVFSGRQPSLNTELFFDCKIRYAHKQSPSTIILTDKNTAQITFKQPQKAITPGQAIVFYDGDIVIGGGTIDKV